MFIFTVSSSPIFNEEMVPSFF